MNNPLAVSEGQGAVWHPAAPAPTPAHDALACQLCSQGGAAAAVLVEGVTGALAVAGSWSQAAPAPRNLLDAAREVAGGFNSSLHERISGENGPSKFGVIQVHGAPAVCAPLIAQGEMLGVAVLFYPPSASVDEARLTLIAQAADVVAVALQQAAAQRLASHRGVVAAAVRSLLLALADGDSDAAFAARVVAAVRSLFSAARVSLLQWNDVAGAFLVGAVTPDEPADRKVGRAEAAAAKRALMTQAPVSVGVAQRSTAMVLPLFTGAAPFGALLLTYGPGVVFDDAGTNALVEFGADLCDILQRRSDLLYAERRRQLAEAFFDIMADVTSPGRLREIPQRIIGTALTVMHADAAVLYRLEEQGAVLVAQQTTGVGPTLAKSLRIPIGRHGLTLEHGPVAQFRPELQAGLRRVGNRYPAAIVIPIASNGDFSGALSLHYAQSRLFTAEEEDLALRLSDYVGLAQQNAALRRQVEETATTAERERLARELHDTVSQTLFAASLHADLAPDLWDRNPEDGRRALSELRTLTRSALREMRQLLLELRPAQLVQAELSELLQGLAESFSARREVPVAVHVLRVGPLPPDVQLAFYRTAQESLQNIVKHARATQVKLSLAPTKHGLVLDVADNGQGFDPGAVGPTHHGLEIMRERTAAIAGKLTIRSSPGKGTELRLEWARATRRTATP